ncbi:MAG: glycosyltransferase family 4 protein [Dehalococcoidales bacterium]|nr:glycosyltransferase family 4 protein [Dehalococcoidales bacterium]
MNILFIHEVDWLNKVVFDIHSLSELMSIRGHNVYAIDYENKWKRLFPLDFFSCKTREVGNIARAVPGAAVTLRRPGLVKVPGISRLSAGFTHWREIRRTIREKKIDVIVLYSVPTNGLQTIRLAREFNIPIVFRSIDILNQLVPNRLLRPVVRRMEAAVYTNSDMILTLTPMLSLYVAEKGAKEETTKVLPMPVDTGIFHPGIDAAELHFKWGIGEKDKVILFMGTLFDFNGLDDLIPQFFRVIKSVPEAKLLIVGDGPQRARIDSLIKASGLGKHAVITGFEPYALMPKYINMASVCINTFRITDATRDIFPGKTVQFLACGKTLIATALPGMTAVIGGEDKGVVYVNNTAVMVNEIIDLLQSDERRQRIERAGLSYVTQVHSYDRIANQLEDYLKQAIAQKKGSSENKTGPVT